VSWDLPDARKHAEGTTAYIGTDLDAIPNRVLDECIGLCSSVTTQSILPGTLGRLREPDNPALGTQSLDRGCALQTREDEKETTGIRGKSGRTYPPKSSSGRENVLSLQAGSPIAFFPFLMC
jgi:hypothetical protein